MLSASNTHSSAPISCITSSALSTSIDPSPTFLISGATTNIATYPRNDPRWSSNLHTTVPMHLFSSESYARNVSCGHWFKKYRYVNIEYGSLSCCLIRREISGSCLSSSVYCVKVIFDTPSDVFERDGMQMVSGGRRGGIGGGGPGLTGMCYCSVGKGVLCVKK